MEAMCRAQEKQLAEAARLLGDAPAAVAAGAVQPGGASVAQLVEAMEDVW